MKNLRIINLAIPVILLLFFFNAEAQTVKSKSGKNASSKNASSLSMLNGSWRIVSINENGKITNRGQLSNIIALNDGFYSWFGPDSTGNWNKGGAGTYEISSNTFKQKIQYSSWPERIGTINWNEFQMKGDTLYVRFKKRINPKGEDVTANYPATESKWVRSEKLTF
jgi:hypothetical protein